MGEVRCAFIELEPTDNAVIGEIFRNARFGYAQMFSELRFEGIRAAPAGASPQKIADGDAQSLAGLDVVIASEVGIGKNENTGADGSVIRFAEFHGSASEQPSKLHFE